LGESKNSADNSHPKAALHDIEPNPKKPLGYYLAFHILNTKLKTGKQKKNKKKVFSRLL
jgi:hypothetical protein